MKEIERIVQRYEEACRSKELLALGTVVKVEGSAYRRIGARLLVNNTGQWVGGISGGCLEGDALKRAKIAILKNKSSIVVYDTTEDDPHQIGVGLGCNGRIEVLFTPIETNDKNNQIEFLKAIVHRRQPTILLQVLSIKNGNQNLCGQFFTLNNLDSLVEITQIPLSRIQERITKVIHKRKSNIFQLENKKGTTYEILFEHIRPKVKLVCVGDNYDVFAMVNIANELGWEVHLVGKTRKVGKFLLQKVHTFTDITDGDSIRTDEYTAIVLMSHDYKTDLRFLKLFIHLEVPYIGLLGPRKRMLKMQNDFDVAGVNLTLVNQSNLYAPVGLDIGAETPEEIANAIASEIIAVLRKRNGQFLKKRTGAIHERLR